MLKNRTSNQRRIDNIERRQARKASETREKEHPAPATRTTWWGCKDDTTSAQTDQKKSFTSNGAKEAPKEQKCFYRDIVDSGNILEGSE